MSKIKITLADAKAELRDAATGPGSQHWGYAPAVKALLNSHDELLVMLGEATVALEEKDQRIAELEVTQMTGPLSLVLKRAAELERIIEGVDQLAIDGGWTARGLSEYAKSLETRNAELEHRLQQPVKLPAAEGEVEQNYLDKIIEALNSAGVQIRYNCPRCNGLLDLTCRPNGDHYCHQLAKAEIS